MISLFAAESAFSYASTQSESAATHLGYPSDFTTPISSSTAQLACSQMVCFGLAEIFVAFVT